MDQKYGEFVGVDSLYYALVTQNDAAAYVAGTPQILAPAAEIGASAALSKLSTYYDNKAANTFITEGPTEVKVVVPNVPAEVMATLLGKIYDDASGRVFDEGVADPPDIALGFRYNMGTSGYRYYWYFLGNFSGGTEEAVTKKDNVDVKTYELTYTAIPTSYQFTVDGALKVLKRVYGDTADGAFDETGWFSQVQTPTAVTPSALELSSIVPLDEATGVSVDTTIVLTFNNEIGEEAVTLNDMSTGDPVAVTGAWDTAGKVLTLTPDSSLGASKEYMVAINGVVDVYGQELSASAKTFTTA